MKKKIAKLESKIKLMDKVTVRRGTQTDDQLDKVNIFHKIDKYVNVMSNLQPYRTAKVLFNKHVCFFAQNVHDALRMAEESLAVNQSELTSVQGKLKNAQQEVNPTFYKIRLLFEPKCEIIGTIATLIMQNMKAPNNNCV